MIYSGLRNENIHVYLADNNLKSSEIHNSCLKSFAKGCGGKILNVKDYQESKVAVVFGVYKKSIKSSYYRGEIISKQKDKGNFTIVIDSGFIRQDYFNNKYYSVGYDNIIGWGNYRNNSMPGDRWKKLNVKLKDWKNNIDGNIIICGQIPWDASCQHVNINDWLIQTVKKIKKISKNNIIYRPHPLAIGHNPERILGCKTSFAPIEEDFKDAMCTVVFNSTSATESIINGIPVVCLGDGCVAEKVSVKSLELINNLIKPDRSQWLNDLCYAQWNTEEMLKGDPWLHLTR